MCVFILICHNNEETLLKLFATLVEIKYSIFIYVIWEVLLLGVVCAVYISFLIYE
jgi:hypothetical protein